MRCLRAGAILASLFLATLGPGCSTPLPENRLDHPSYYFDNTLSFQPNRIWRLTVSWEPYLLDDKKAMIVKQYQFVVHGDADRRRLDLEIAAHGGERGYLRWLESELFPLGNWDVRDEAHVSHLRDMTLVTLRTKALKEVPKEGLLTVRPVWFPDPLFRGLTDGCHQLNWDVISRDESVGFEIVLKSRHLNPDAERWTRQNPQATYPETYPQSYHDPQTHAHSHSRLPDLKSPPPELTGVTTVTTEPHVTTGMGIRMVPTKEGGDSVKWWERRESGWSRWMQARSRFPRAKSYSVDLYLDALAEGFNRAVGAVPATRFHFYVADTLNPTLWPLGGGFFVIHAGLFRQIRDERQLAFLLALELAHETLDHGMSHGALARGVSFPRHGDVFWEAEGRNEAGYALEYDGWPIEFWAYLVGRDPIESADLGYTLQQESDALELVYQFFRANGWEYDGINRLVADLLPTLTDVPGSSSLAKLHPHLATAVKVPHARMPARMQPVDAVVNRLTYQRAVAEIERSTLQHYPWMLELVPYRDFIVDRGINIDEVREGYNEHSDVHTSKILTATRKSRLSSLATELDEFLERNAELDARDKLLPARLARIYLRGTILLAHHRWADVIRSAEEGLKIDASAEPFLWQRALARQQLGQFNKSIAEMPVAWKNFDHRRDLFVLQGHFLEGRFTEASRAGLEYRRKYPFDIDGAFWHMLAEIRLRRTTDRNIDELAAFWGDRPMVRALKVFYYGYLGKFTDAQAALDLVDERPAPTVLKLLFFGVRSYLMESSDVFQAKGQLAVNDGLAYPAYEWGMLAFAQAWFRQTFNVIHGDDRADKLMQLAELQWPLSRLVRYNLPRDVVQNR
ncbi:MAG: hypothetical protein HY075_02005 [Deltaproteobacteria bacterium]|nr:hypothetical protein [Deltaproteobacteria bacterium]